MTRIAVITAPQPIMTAEQVRAGMPALAGVADAVLDGLIAAATEELDGPTGWLGRSLGAQVLELRASAFPCGGIRLALPPIGAVDAVTYADASGADVVIAQSEYNLCGDVVLPAHSWPAGGNVRVRYSAGYAADALPGRIKIAVQLRVGELNMQMQRDGALKKEVVDGVGSFEYEVGSGGARSATSRAVESLLAGLRVWSI